MNFWEILSLIGLGATVLGAWLTASSYYNGERTRVLMRDVAALSDQRHRGTQDMIREMFSGTQAATRDLIREMQSEMRASFERMDRRADEPHREVIRAIQTLRA